MKIEKISIVFFLLLLLLVPLIYTTEIITGFLLARYIGWALALAICFILLYKPYAKGTLNISISGIFGISFLLLSCLSFFTAINFSEALYETSKLSLLLISIWLASILIRESRTKSLFYIPLFASIATLVAVVFSMGEFFEALRSDVAWADAVYLIKAFNGHKNLLATWMMLLIPLTLLGLFREKKSVQIIYWIALLFQLIIVGILQTRAAYVGLIAGLLCYFIISFLLKQQKADAALMGSFYVLATVLGIGILLIYLTPVAENALSSIQLNSPSAQERIVIWEKSLEMIKSNSIFGVGGGNWKIQVTNLGVEGLYRAELNNVVFRRPHNDILWIWSEHGLFALLAYLGFLLSLLYFSFKQLLNDAANSKFILICLSGIVAYVFMSLFDFPKERIEHNIAFGLMIAVLIYHIREVESSFQLPIKKGMAVMVSAALLLFFAYLGYSRFGAEKLIKQTIAYKEAGNNLLMLESARQVDQTFIQMDDNGFPITWYEGVANFNLGAKELAASNFDEAYGVNPYNFNVLNNVATGEFVRKNFPKAEQFYLEALRINPSFEGAKMNLISVYINLQEWNKANIWLNQLSTRSQRSENMRVLIEENLKP